MARKPGTSDPEHNLRLAQTIAQAIDQACRAGAVVTWMDLADDEDDEDDDEDDGDMDSGGADDPSIAQDGSIDDEADAPTEDDVYFVIDAQIAPGPVEELRQLAGARLRVRPRGSVLLMVADLGGDEADDSAPLSAVRIAPEAVDELRRFDPSQDEACRLLADARDALEQLLDELPYFAEWVGSSPEALRGRRS